MIRGHSRADGTAVPKTKVTMFSDFLRTEDAINLSHLERLRDDFEARGGTLVFDDFQLALARVMGEDARSELFRRKADTLFKKMDANNSGDVDWDEFCSYMMKDVSPYSGDPPALHAGADGNRGSKGLHRGRCGVSWWMGEDTASCA